MVEQPQLSPASDTAQSREMARLVEQMTLQRRIKSGANNFYWVAALSVINSLVNIFQGSLYFVVGLAATLFVDGLTSALAKDLGRSPLILGIGFAVSALVAAVFALFGFFAGKQKVWAFAVGMGFYVLDSVIMLVFQEWLGLLFHLLFLWGMWSGFQALRKLRSLQQPAMGFSAVPPAESMR